MRLMVEKLLIQITLNICSGSIQMLIIALFFWVLFSVLLLFFPYLLFSPLLKTNRPSREQSFLAFQDLHRYNGVEGLDTTEFVKDKDCLVCGPEFVKDKDCLVCGPGILIELDTSVSLKKFIDQLEDNTKLLLSKVSVMHRGKNLYMQAPPVLEEMTRPNLDIPLYDMMDKSPKDIVHVTCTAGKSDTRQSFLRKLHVVFKGIDGVIDMDMAGGA